MIRFKSLKFEGVIPFSGETVVPLENMGRVFLAGENQDTGGSNGAGKSTVFEVLQHILFSTTSKGFARGKFVGQGYRGELLLEVDGHDYSITQFRGAKGEERKDGYTILKDGKDVTPKGTRHMQDCINFIKEIVGITEAEFRGYVYLAQEGPGHVLISGKGADKRNYLSDLFTLDRYDSVREGVDEELILINANIGALSEKAAVRDELKEQLDDITMGEEDFKEFFESLKGTKTFIDEKHEVWSARLKEADAAKSKVEERRNLEIQLEQIFPKWQELDTQDAISQRQVKVRNLLNRIEKLEQLAEITDEKSELEELYISDLDTSLEEAISALNDVQSKVTLLEEEVKLVKRRLVLEEKLPDVTGVSDDLEERLKKTNEALIRMKMELKTAEETLTSTKELVGSDCPTCGHSLDVEAIQKSRELSEKVVKSLKPAIQSEKRVSEELRKLADKSEEHARVMAQMGELPEGSLADRSEAISEFGSEVSRLKEVVEQVRENGRVSRRLGELSEALVEFSSSLDPDKLEEYKEKARKLDKQVTKLQTLHTLKTQLDSMPEIEVLDEDEYERSSELAEHYEDSRSELAVQISEAKSRKKSYKALSERLKELEASLEVWEEVQHRKSLFEAMKAAYGPKGLKIHQLKKICNAICKTLPKYTTVMFQEPRIEFFVDNDPDSTEIEFYIRRFLKTGTEEYPVGKLSGGEKKRLAVAFIFALADLVAPRKKCNLIVLDEVGDGLDPVGEYAFASQLLPQLTQESVVITSHRPGIESAQFDTNWSVTKKDNRSTFSG
jgi:DNA repair exonuclease SbcCD ATPase subunit